MRAIQLATLFLAFFWCNVSTFHVRHQTTVQTGLYKSSLSAHCGKFVCGYDEEFANAISKPLPRWYIEASIEKERLLKELERNRDRILQEFRAKYEVSKEQREAERLQRLEAVKQKLRGKRPQAAGWWEKLWAGPARAVDVSHDVEDTAAEAEDIVSTKEKWDAFWKEEEAQTGFYLPGLLEVFPELQFKWPTWSKRPDGTAVECEADEDCPFPQACCPHPIVPGLKFCCTGWGQRVMIPQYAFQPLISEVPVTDAPNRRESGVEDRFGLRD